MKGKDRMAKKRDSRFLQTVLTNMKACSGAVEWVDDQPGTWKGLWDGCEKAEWLPWISVMAGVDDRRVLKATVDTVITYIERRGKKNKTRTIGAIEYLKVVKRWADGKVSYDSAERAYDAFYDHRRGILDKGSRFWDFAYSSIKHIRDIIRDGDLDFAAHHSACVLNDVLFFLFNTSSEDKKLAEIFRSFMSFNVVVNAYNRNKLRSQYES